MGSTPRNPRPRPRPLRRTVAAAALALAALVLGTGTALVGTTVLGASPAQAAVACDRGGHDHFCIYSLPNRDGDRKYIEWNDDCLDGDRWEGGARQGGGPMNDDIGSIDNVGGHFVKYFEHCNYGGAYDYVRSHTYSNFQDNWWNNRISSFKWGEE
jgi:hypothetical protein